MPPSGEKLFVVVERWSGPGQQVGLAYHGPGTSDEARDCVARLEGEPLPEGARDREVGVTELLRF